MKWQCGDRLLNLERPLIMGIVNATPDSFSDGGLFATHQAAIAHARTLIKEGADIVDIGGESTRPGAASVSVDEELDRVIPVIETLVADGAVVSVDTSKAAVMREAIAAGAKIVNDVCALTQPGALGVVSASQVGVCLMHMRGSPETMQNETQYEDVVSEVKDFLLARALTCEAAGIARSRICLDFGFGFGKTVEQNFRLLAHTEAFASLPYPLLVGLSRKSSLGAVTGREPRDRVSASVAGALLAAQMGAHILRVHDVAQTRDAFTIWSYTQNAKNSF